MKCGKGHDHRTVEEVRACYGVQSPNYSNPGGHDWRQDPAKPAQYSYLKILREELGVEAKFTGQITKGQASEEISDLKDLKARRKAEASRAVAAGVSWNDAGPKTGSGSGLEAGPVNDEWTGGLPAKHDTRIMASEFPEITAGFYAAPSLTGNNDLDFWKVDVPETGRWAGYVFVKRIIGGRDATRIPRKTQGETLKAIRDAGPQKASERFGQELGLCGKCGRSLTDETSRQIGIGPVCRSR